MVRRRPCPNGPSGPPLRTRPVVVPCVMAPFGGQMPDPGRSATGSRSARWSPAHARSLAPRVSCPCHLLGTQPTPGHAKSDASVIVDTGQNWQRWDCFLRLVRGPEALSYRSLAKPASVQASCGGRARDPRAGWLAGERILTRAQAGSRWAKAEAAEHDDYALALRDAGRGLSPIVSVAGKDVRFP